MADTITPNMGLVLPEVGVEVGPDWAENLNADLSAIDSHSHSSGQGVPITPDGISISSDLPFNNNNATLVKTMRFRPQTSIVAGAADIGCLQEVGVDLYYIDGSGNQIRITQSGSLSGAAGTITGLPSGTASASFAASTFTFQSATNTPASMNVGPTKIGQAVASGFGVTISANSGQASNYGLNLPAALPASTKFVTLDASGNVGDSYDVDNSTLEVSAGIIQVKNGGITNAKLATPVADTGNGSSSVSTSGTSYAQITGSAVITATGGRPVLMMICPYIGANNQTTYSSTNSTDLLVEIRRDGTAITSTLIVAGSQVQGGVLLTAIDPTPSAGSHTYTAHARQITGIGSTTFQYVSLYVIEM